ncbi:hypothetical protein BRD56_11795 [Thermoplasmatales archaeon SW_10_69_26]|nr:MAG: hypothetical protein BRD56_11795 [Thermoplasmatales archaeon SW_10_69_26]
MTRKRRGTARWQGDLDTGEGTLSTDSGVLQAAFDAASRFADGEHRNPEELIAAAHTVCCSMALTDVLQREGYEPDNVRTEADVELDADGGEITSVRLVT